MRFSSTPGFFPWKPGMQRFFFLAALQQLLKVTQTFYMESLKIEKHVFQAFWDMLVLSLVCNSFSYFFRLLTSSCTKLRHHIANAKNERALWNRFSHSRPPTKSSIKRDQKPNYFDLALAFCLALVAVALGWDLALPSGVRHGRWRLRPGSGTSACRFFFVASARTDLKF